MAQNLVEEALSAVTLAVRLCFAMLCGRHNPLKPPGSLALILANRFLIMSNNKEMSYMAKQAKRRFGINGTLFYLRDKFSKDEQRLRCGDARPLRAAHLLTCQLAERGIAHG